MEVLPLELIRECLLRVPYTYHPNLAAVCRRWEAVVKNPEFYEDRKKFGISQHCICVTEIRLYRHDFDFQYWISVYDPVEGTWEQLPRIPHFPGDHLQGIPSNCHHVCVNRKLLLLGGRNPNDLESVYTVLIYDFTCAKWSRGTDMPAKWSRGTDMPIRAIDGACTVSPEGLVYVAGGNSLRGAAVYNVEKDEWKILPQMNQQWSRCLGAFIAGKFFVVGDSRTVRGDAQKVDAEVYDPEKGAWATLPDMLTVSKGRVASSSDGVLYCFQKEEGVVKVYNSEENVWKSVGPLPQTLGRIECCGAWRDGILVSNVARLGPANRDNFFHLWKPPRKECEAELVGGEWSVIPIKKPMDCDQYIQYVATLEI